MKVKHYGIFYENIGKIRGVVGLIEGPQRSIIEEAIKKLEETFIEAVTEVKTTQVENRIAKKSEGQVGPVKRQTAEEANKTEKQKKTEEAMIEVIQEKMV